MEIRFDRLFSNPTLFQYGFFILMFSGIILSKFSIDGQSNFYILYIFSSIFLGIGFYNSSIWLIALLALGIVVSRSFLLSEPDLTITAFIAYLFTYVTITFISVGLMKSTQQVKKDNLSLITALSNAIDSRDKYTMNHSKNVAAYSVQIAEKMNLPPNILQSIRIGGLLHDIGKIGISEYILNKPGKLTEEEFAVIKSHPIIGYDMIKHIDSFRKDGILHIVLYHHEKYDGTGYPKGLKGKEIPLVARIVSVADVFDAMSSKRIYRDEIDYNVVLTVLQENKGTQFDPEIVDIFISLYKEQKITPPID
ncbi:HDIG domain-containing protein [Oceanobacillus limi]|uniref:HDIG domain-containing protein n=1 Tax=Oceanobacillus limi TaxID=930131 RepID=A0A1I0FEU9_9BACI|nr:HD-GYP domain-containing protein [Oceanobacillus limi]SET56688.1 HDIG domain-containing protein [Oceanobacillus limi]